MRPRACAPGKRHRLGASEVLSSLVLADQSPPRGGPREGPRRPRPAVRPAPRRPPPVWGESRVGLLPGPPVRLPTRGKGGPRPRPAVRGSPPGGRWRSRSVSAAGRPPSPASLRVGAGSVPRRVPFGGARPSAPFGSRPAAVACRRRVAPGSGGRGSPGPGPLARAGSAPRPSARLPGAPQPAPASPSGAAPRDARAPPRRRAAAPSALRGSGGRPASPPWGAGRRGRGWSGGVPGGPGSLGGNV